MRVACNMIGLMRKNLLLSSMDRVFADVHEGHGGREGKHGGAHMAAMASGVLLLVNSG